MGWANGSNPSRSIAPRRGEIGWWIVSRGFGLLLLVAAGLKADALIVRGQQPYPSDWHQTIDLAAILIEMPLGVWLISGVQKRLARSCALFLLSLLASAAGWHIVAGDAECGCFGDITVHPGVTLAVDLIAILSLWYYGRRLSRLTSERSVWRRRAGIGYASTFAVASVAIASVGAPRNRETPVFLRQIRVDRRYIDLGTVDANTIARAQLELENISATAISILSISPECSCTSAAPPAHTIAPYSRVSVPVFVDVRHIPSGTFQKRVVVKIADSAKTSASIVFTLAGSVNHIMVLSPLTNRLEFLVGGPGTIRRSDDHPLYISGPKELLSKLPKCICITSSEPALFNVNWDGRGDDFRASTVNVRLIVNSTWPVGACTSSITFHVNGAVSQTLTVPVSILVGRWP